MSATTIDPSVALARKWAAFYSARGMQPLPSDPKPADGRKKPLCRFKDYWEAKAPADLFSRFETTNIQVITGRFWKLLVIDLDGQAGRDWFWALGKPVPRTWGVRSGSGTGMHLWFRLPPNFETPLPKAFLWESEARQADKTKHETVERLCDRSLVMAPPSIHPVTGNRYTWLQDDQFLPPTKMPLPALCPQWILDLPPVPPKREASHPIVAIPSAAPLTSHGGWYDWREVQAVIPDKVSLAARWGVRFTGSVSRGWAECHAIDRRDEKPSAAVDIETGRYVDLGSGTRLGLFNLAVALGVAPDFRSAVSALGEQYRAKQREAMQR